VNVRGIKSENIMESLKTAPADLTGYTKIVLDGKSLWVKLKEANNGFSKAEIELAAAFLETHRYAALKGGSMAFTKMEGTTVNIKDKVAYSALANIQESMIGGNAAWVESHNVKFKSTLKAGGVLGHDLKGSQVDHLNNVINSEWTPYQSHMVLMGKDITVDGLGNTADPNNIASPDNLKFSETLRTLFIGEDSGNHTNNFLWAYNVDTKSLDRILSTPAGAESTGLHAVDSVNGWTYIMSNFQHPGDSSKLSAELKAKVLENYNGGYSACVGYITADVLPSVEKKAETKK